VIKSWNAFSASFLARIYEPYLKPLSVYLSLSLSLYLALPNNAHKDSNLRYEHVNHVGGKRTRDCCEHEIILLKSWFRPANDLHSQERERERERERKRDKLRVRSSPNTPRRSCAQFHGRSSPGFRPSTREPISLTKVLPLWDTRIHPVLLIYSTPLREISNIFSTRCSRNNTAVPSSYCRTGLLNRRSHGRASPNLGIPSLRGVLADDVAGTEAERFLAYIADHFSLWHMRSGTLPSPRHITCCSFS